MIIFTAEITDLAAVYYNGFYIYAAIRQDGSQYKIVGKRSIDGGNTFLENEYTIYSTNISSRGITFTINNSGRLFLYFKNTSNELKVLESKNLGLNWTLL